MKRSFSLILGLASIVLCAQQSPEIIYCNEYQNVALVMSAPIAQAVTGSENFVFSYNQTAVDSLGLLQGRPGADSNLLIRTTDGGLYSYMLRYKDSLSGFVHFIKPESRINPLPTQLGSTVIPGKELKTKVKPKNDSYYKKLAKYYLKRTPHRLAVRNKGRLKLEVQGMYYYREDVFFVLEIQNRSTIDFRIDDLSLAKIHGSKNRKSSYQKLVLKTLYREDFPEMVLPGSQARFVLVYPKFTLGDHEKLEVVLNEDSGSRYVAMMFN